MLQRSHAAAVHIEPQIQVFIQRYAYLRVPNLPCHKAHTLPTASSAITMPKVRKLPRTVLCHQCGKAFYDDAGCKSHGEAKRHTWKPPQPRVALTTLARTTSLPDASSSGCDDAALTTTATASTGDLDLLQKELKGLRGAQVALVSHATFIVNHVSSLPGLHSLALSVNSPTTSKTPGVGGCVCEDMRIRLVLLGLSDADLDRTTGTCQSVGHRAGTLLQKSTMSTSVTNNCSES